MLTPKQIRALPFILAGNTQEEVARKAKCTTRAIQAWYADEEFMQVVSEYLDARISESLQKAGSKLADAATEATEELVRMMRESRQYPELHLKIITTILDRLQRVAEYRKPRGVSREN